MTKYPRDFLYPYFSMKASRPTRSNSATASRTAWRSVSSPRDILPDDSGRVGLPDQRSPLRAVTKGYKSFIRPTRLVAVISGRAAFRLLNWGDDTACTDAWRLKTWGTGSFLCRSNLLWALQIGRNTIASRIA